MATPVSNRYVSTEQMDDVDSRFEEWLTCPECENATDISILAHRADIVFECYECGKTSEFTIGKDVPVSNLDTNVIEQFVHDE